MDNRKAFSEIKYCRIVKEMNISFANFGIEECETCDEYKIHIYEHTKEMRAIERAKKKNDDPAAKEKGCAVPEEDVAAVIRKKTRKQTDGKEAEKCLEDSIICNSYISHDKDSIKSREEYNMEKPKWKQDKETAYLSFTKGYPPAKVTFLQKKYFHLPSYHVQHNICSDR